MWQCSSLLVVCLAVRAAAASGHTLKDSVASLRSLGRCTLRKKHCRCLKCLGNCAQDFLKCINEQTHIYHAIVKSTITYAAETLCLKAKTEAKLNFTEMDFWRRSTRISRKDKIRNNIIEQKMNVTSSLLEDIKTKQLQWYGRVQRMEEGRLPKEVMKWRPLGRRKRGRPKLTWAEGTRGLMGE
jgi:hypothetical protein